MARAALLAAMLFAQPAIAGDLSDIFASRHQGDWSGAYVGAYGGAAISVGQARLNDFAGALLPLDVEYGLFPQKIGDAKANAAVGFIAGVNFQNGGFVGGLEGDIGYAWTKAHDTYSRIDNVPTSPFPGVSTNTRYETDFGAIGTVRARAGYAWGNTLLFGTAGVAAGHAKNRFELSLPEIGYRSPDWSSSSVRFGYAIGIGAEQRLTSNISLRLETLYINLADTTVRGTDATAFPGESISYRFTNDIVMPRLGLNVKF